MAQSLSCLNYHLIFSTKNRAAMIIADVQSRLYEYMGGIIRDHGGKLIAAGGMNDHVHLLASLTPRYSLSDMLRDIKGGSSKWIHDTFPTMESFGWQDRYGAFSVSQSNIASVREYIMNQEEHHKRFSFQEEFIQFLERHGIEYDPRYVWT